MERVAIAFEREQTSQKIRRLLEGAGMARGICCRTAAEVKLLLGQQQISTAICGYKLPDATAEELLFDLLEGRTLLLVAPENLLGLCREAPVLFRLSTPLSQGALLEGVRDALRASGLSHRPGREEETALIPRAKEWLMERRGVSEEEAHRLLQKKSMASGRRLADTARLLLERETGLAIY